MPDRPDRTVTLDESGAETGMYTIPAGGRRFRALELLVNSRRMNKAARVPCIVRTDGLAEEDGLAENVQRTPLPDPMPIPFDVAVSRKVGIDGLISLEGRQYSVPFRLIGETVEVRGIAGGVQILKACQIVAEHPRGTAARLLIDQAHYDGPSDDRVIAPPPLGRMGRKVQELIDAPVAHRAIETYHLLVEVAR